jgi:hypothetical protein
MEREAMAFACELIHTSKAYTTMVCTRLEIISHEDIDTQAAPHIIPFVRLCCDQARDWYDDKNGNPGRSRMAIGNAIRMMARAPKSREGDHYQAAIGLANLLEGEVPAIDHWLLDKHTLRGKRTGRGLQHFRDEGAKLIPPTEAKDAYEDEGAAGGPFGGIVKLCLLTAQRRDKVAEMKRSDIIDGAWSSKPRIARRATPTNLCCPTSRSASSRRSRGSSVAPTCSRAAASARSAASRRPRPRSTKRAALSTGLYTICAAPRAPYCRAWA